MKLRYQIPADIQQSSAQSSYFLSTAQNGKIALDRPVWDVWQQASNRSAEEITSLSPHRENPIFTRAALACLAEAGVLIREGDKVFAHNVPNIEPSLVSIIIVSKDSRDWLENCLRSIFSQQYDPIQIIVVDNASQDGSADWIESCYPEVKMIRLAQPGSLAYAINLGVRAAGGKYCLLLNPDAELEQGAISHLVEVAQQNPRCAAVATKLKFLWAPAFLNGLGNSVGALSWGTDSGLGHLDLGQFDHWDEIPSACFAAALIPTAAWSEVGLLDEGFPLYYEDSEWCYRARLFGYSVRAAPKAVVYHAFSGRAPASETEPLSPRKLERVVYGRLRFITKLLGLLSLIRFMTSYCVEDVIRFALALSKRRLSLCQAYIRAWKAFLKSLPELRRERRLIQARRQCSDRDLFQLQRTIPVPLVRDGLPYLTWDLVINHYLPLILAGKTRPIVEFSEDFKAGDLPKPHPRQSLFRRALSIYKNEGWRALCHHAGKNLQWRLAKP